MQTIAAVGLPEEMLPWEGTIHSVFRSSCNVRLASGLLLTVHDFDFGTLPRSLYVPGLSTALLRPGDPARGDRGGVILGRLRLEWSGQTALVDTAIPRRGALPRDLAPAWSLLKEKQQGTEQDPLLQEIYRRLRQTMELLWQGLACGDMTVVRTQCAACIGLGQGLTPSGDDMLLGMLTALHMYRPKTAALLGETVLQLTAQTNDISRTYLELAVQGYAATPVIRAAERPDSRETVEILLSVGHSSGCDILEGILTTVQKISA